MSRFLFHAGRFVLMLGGMFRSMERPAVYLRLMQAEFVGMVAGSMLILVVISVFIGAVMTLQTAYQLTSDFVPKSTIGSIVSVTTLLELAPTILTFILAGRIGSKIASELGTMRVTEQIDALEVMGINAHAYLILPKILAGFLALPVLVTFSAFLTHVGGMYAGHYGNMVTMNEFADGMRMYFELYQITIMYVKAFTFGLLITMISAYQGFYTQGGALEVGNAATRAVVFSCLAMVIADFLIAQIML